MIIKAMVRCKDGRCYPCQFLDWMTDYGNLLPMAFIRFTDERPVDSNVVMVTNMLNIYFGGNDVQDRKTIDA